MRGKTEENSPLKGSARLMKKTFVFLAALFLCLSPMMALAAEDTLVVANGADIRVLDPLPSSENVSANVLLQMFENLVFIAPDGSLEPMLAESWEQPTPTSYVFHIRKGVKFHNGEECTADDVKFTLDRAKTPLGTSAHALIKDLKDVEVLDRYTVKINLGRPVTPFLYALGESWAGIVNKKAVEEGDPAKNPVGTGPFKFVSWKKADRVILERFEDYHGKKPNFKTLVVRAIPEASSRTIELQSGAVDVAYGIHFSDFERIESDKNLTLLRHPSNRVDYIALNCQRPALKDVRVRRAIKMALDIPGMQKAVCRGVGSVTGSPLPPGMRYALKDAPIPAQDVEGAKKLLEEAGVKDLKLAIWTNESKERMDAATIIQGMLEEVGITAEIRVMEYGAFLDGVRKGECDLAMSGWGNNLPDPEYFFGRTFHSIAIGANNSSHYSNPKLDELLDKGLTVPDGEERAKIYEEVQQIILDDVPAIFWSVGEAIVGINNRVKNFEMHPKGFYRLWMAELDH